MLKSQALFFLLIFVAWKITSMASEERISVKKCKEYNNLYRELYQDPIHKDIQEFGPLQCPTFASSGTIVGGRDAEAHEYPAMAALMYAGSKGLIARCGGVLISEQFVLTAAHCFKGQAPQKVAVGEIRLAASKLSTKRVDLDIEQIIQHEKYKPGLGLYDIALIKLARPLPLRYGLKQSIRPACLQQEEIPPTVNVSATGFGRTEAFGATANVLQTVDLPNVDRKECSDFYRDALDFDQRFPGVSEEERDAWVLPSSVLCAGGIADKDTCQGDSGGPIFFSPDKRYVCHRHVVGVTSFGSSYCGSKIPGVYTKVSAYIDWIEKHVWQNNS